MSSLGGRWHVKWDLTIGTVVGEDLVATFCLLAQNNICNVVKLSVPHIRFFNYYFLCGIVTDLSLQSRDTTSLSSRPTSNSPHQMCDIESFHAYDTHVSYYRCKRLLKLSKFLRMRSLEMQDFYFHIRSKQSPHESVSWVTLFLGCVNRKIWYYVNVGVFYFGDIEHVDHLILVVSLIVRCSKFPVVRIIIRFDVGMSFNILRFLNFFNLFFAIRQFDSGIYWTLFLRD